MNKIDNFQLFREEYLWDIHDLNQKEQDFDKMEEEDERMRQQELEEWFAFLEEQNQYYCVDQFLFEF